VQSRPLPLIEHFDGTSWVVVPSPRPQGDAELNAVTAVAPDDAWAVGGSGRGAFAEHWDGTSWTIENPPAKAASDLTGVVARTASDVWAVGVDAGAAMSWHCDGSAWREVPVGTSGGLTSIGVAPDGYLVAGGLGHLILAMRP
jgi:hypothetical protein